MAWRGTARDRWCALAAGVLFALHPVQAETVTWIAGRNDLLATLFTLGALLAFLQYRSGRTVGWLLALVFFQAAAVFAKESGLTLVGLLFAADLVWLRPGNWRKREVWCPYAGCVLVGVVYFACQRAAFPVSGLAGIGHGPPDLLQLETYLQFACRQLAYLGHLFPPLDVAALEWRSAGGLPAGQWAATAGIAAAVALALGLAGRRWLAVASTPENRRVALFFGAAWYAVATVPLVMTCFSARHLYPAVAGLVIFLVLVLRGALPGRRRFAAVCTALACVCAILLTLRLRPWHDAALTSGRVATAVAEIGREPGHGPLFIDVPAQPDRAYCWTWALPYALRPPFTSTPLDEIRPVLAAPGLHAFENAWLNPHVLDQVTAGSEPGWLVFTTTDGAVRRIAVPAVVARRAASRLRASAASTPTREAWARFVADLRSPSR